MLDIDLATEPMVRAGLSAMGEDPDDRDSERFKSTFRDAIYETLFQLADNNLPHNDVVVTGPFTKEMQNPKWPEEIRGRMSCECAVQCLYLHCEAAIRKKRMTERANPRDTAKLLDWTKHQSYYEQHPLPRYPHLSIDTGQSDPLAPLVSSGLLQRRC